MTFRVGQKVVCVKRNPWVELVSGEIGPSFGKVYVVRETDDCPPGLTLRFEEILNPRKRYLEGVCECSFAARWFLPLDERKSDISFAHEILRKATRQDRVSA